MIYTSKTLFYRYLIFFAGMASIIYFSGTLKIDQSIANKSEGYFVLRNIEQANEAGRLGYIKYEVNDYAEYFKVEWKWKPGMDRMRIIRSGPDDFDDIGYISLLELIAIAGKKITLTFAEKMHNYAFIISLAIFSFVIVKFFKNIIAGWIFMILALILKSKILSLVYGSPDSRTFVIFFPFVVLGIIFALNRLSSHLNKIRGLTIVLLFGILIGVIASIRNSEGMAALYAILFSLVILKIGIKQKTVSAAALTAGYLLITIVMPIILALHRDIKTGEYDGDVSLYLKTTGSHQAWHSLVLGCGKYPNSIGMRYDDISCYDILRARYPDAMDPVRNFHGQGYYAGLRGIYFNYVADYPLEYLKNIAKSYAELFYFIPYATSAGNLTWWRYGYLPLKQGVVPDNWDMPLRTNPRDNLLVLKAEYLKLNSIEWGVFILAIIAVVLAVRHAVFAKIEKGNKAIFLSISAYLFLLATQRALVPQHGFTFVVAFWIFSIISLLYICFNNTKIKDFFYWRLKIFNV